MFKRIKNIVNNSVNIIDESLALANDNIIQAREDQRQEAAAHKAAFAKKMKAIKEGR